MRLYTRNKALDCVICVHIVVSNSNHVILSDGRERFIQGREIIFLQFPTGSD